VQGGRYSDGDRTTGEDGPGVAARRRNELPGGGIGSSAPRKSQGSKNLERKKAAAGRQYVPERLRTRLLVMI